MITLTKEEQKSVVKMVMESHQGITLSEAKTNEGIREEMKLNLEFYNEVKKGFLNEEKTNLEEAAGLVGTILGMLGNIKDFLTGTKVVKDFTNFVNGIIEKLQAKFEPLVDKYIPEKAKILALAAADQQKQKLESLQQLANWLYKTFSYKGLAKVFAMIRYKTLRPSDEQKQCMELAAKKVYRVILIILILAFLIKFGIAAVGALGAKGVAAATTSSTAQASLATSLTPAKAVLAKVGHGSLFKGALSTISAGIKAKDAKNIKADIKAKEQEARKKEMEGFKGAWNYCPLPQKESVEFERMQQLAGL